MDNERTSEKRGWVFGWCGGFVWLVVLAIIKLVEGNLPSALLSSCLAVIGFALIILYSPWRYPMQPYWKLMIPMYILFFASIGWLLIISGGIREIGLSLWSVFLIFPLLMPLFLLGRRRWIDGENKIP